MIVPAAEAAHGVRNLVGSTAVEDWIQEQARVFNDAYAAESRFSFAPDGAKERVSIQHITIDTTAPKDGAQANGIAAVPAGETSWLSSDKTFLEGVGLAVGLPDFASMDFPAGKNILLKWNGQAIDRGSMDLFPGVIDLPKHHFESGPNLMPRPPRYPPIPVPPHAPSSPRYRTRCAGPDPPPVALRR